MDFVLACVGLFLLFFAGDLLVRGAVSLGLRLQIPAIVIGLTIVAFGTSAPELFVTVQASIQGVPGIAIGNVVGSNIANVLLVIGLPALLSPMGDSSIETKRNYLIMMGVTVIAVSLATFQPLTSFEGGLLLGLLALFLFDTYRTTQANRAKAMAEGEEVEDHDIEEISDADPKMPGWKIALLIGAGMIGLPIGSDLTVSAAKNIAVSAGFSPEAIGLTLVAIGTSLPELATTVMAAVRGRADVAIGNVIGSNIFNLLAILGVAATLDNIHIPDEFFSMNFPVMVLSSLALAPFIWLNRDVGRLWGGVFVSIYVVYIAIVLNPSAA